MHLTTNCIIKKRKRLNVLYSPYITTEMSKNAINVEKRETIISLDANADIQLTQQRSFSQEDGRQKITNSSSVTQSKFPPRC